MMKLKDVLCLLAGVALLVLAFQLKGFAEEARPFPAQEKAMEQSIYEIHTLKYNHDCEPPFPQCSDGN